jgi:hypothetical protein
MLGKLTFLISTPFRTHSDEINMEHHILFHGHTLAGPHHDPRRPGCEAQGIDRHHWFNEQPEDA